MLLANTLISNNNNASKLYVDDVFSTYLYTGNGSTQTINNGIDLAGKGGLVWIKCRQDLNTSGAYHGLFDTARGVNKWLQTDSTLPSQNLPSYDGVGYFNSNGFTVGFGGITNDPGEPFVSWTFRKAAKFFDVVTWNGAPNQTISHSLGVAPGMILVKRLGSSEDWYVYHRSRTNCLYLNSSAAEQTWTVFGTVNASSFQVALNTTTSPDGYVAYLFAHDTSTDGIIQCGSYTRSNDLEVNLGWEPQYIKTKRSDGTSDWVIIDTMRGWTGGATSTTTSHANLLANTSGAETTGSQVPYLTITATGFKVAGYGDGATWIYLAIRRPNKPPTTGTQVYNAIARTGTGAAATVTGVGFAPDLVLARSRSGTSPVYGLNNSPHWVSRLTGTAQTLNSSNAMGESTSGSTGDVTGFDTMDGMRVGVEYNTAINASGLSIINHFFKRAPRCF